MNRVVSFFKKLRLGQILAVLIAGVALFLTTACNPGNLQGARPNNLPVQDGGNNNPHSMGGDGYTNYKMSTDPAVNKKANNSTSNAYRGHADLNINPEQLIAGVNIESNSSDLLYPGSDASKSNSPDLGTKRGAVQPESIRSKRQNVIDRSDPNERILEKVGKQFEEASEFLQDTADSAERTPELQRNPALNK
ncbi:MAG TPA: DUF6658 family protein [Crinalium sp.]|jgi:hypothetical protein